MEIDTRALAESLHNGWLGYMRSQGYTWGPSLDKARRQHPDLRPFSELSATAIAREAAIAAALLSAIEDEGLRVEVADAGRQALGLEKAMDVLVAPLAIATFRTWAKNQPHLAELPAVMTTAQWHQFSDEHKRAQDTAAVVGLLGRLYEMGFAITGSAVS